MRNTIRKSCAEFSKFLHSIDQHSLPDYRDRFFEHVDIIADQISRSDQPEEDSALFFESCGPIDASFLHRRTRKKPLGYAGDFLLIDWIYTHKTADSGVGRLFDEMFHTYEAARAVRNRKKYFIEKCRELAEGGKKHVNILDLGCGSCRDVVEAYTLCNNGTRYHFHCIDHEPQAIEYAKTLLGDSGAGNQVTLECANVFKFRGDGKYDLIWSAGLFDYLENRVATLLIRKFWKYLGDGGKIIFGNFSPLNPTRKGMELVGQWHLIHRSAHELIGICEEANVPYASLEVESEELGINLFCIITK
ncbi:MAG TPA: class I SAM-dependent methyltransferase [bacterium]|nr:class I SAM-dependent methyltransferase [bacterium]